MAFHYSPKIITDGLIFYIDAQNSRGYEADLSKVYNLARKEQGSTFNYLSNTIDFQQPPPPGPGDGVSIANDSGILSFEGEGTDEFLRTVGGAPFNKLGPELTYSVWINYTRGDLFAAAIYCGGTGGSTQRSWLYTYGNNISFQVSDGSSAASLFWSGYTAVDYPNDWNCITSTLSVNLSGTDSTARTYVNGEMVAENTSLSIIAERTSSTNEPEIGRGGSSGEQRLQGKIASAMIYNRGLSEDEVKQNYNATKTRFGL